jgi:hypothetical protein
MVLNELQVFLYEIPQKPLNPFADPDFFLFSGRRPSGPPA